MIKQISKSINNFKVIILPNTKIKVIHFNLLNCKSFTVIENLLLCLNNLFQVIELILKKNKIFVLIFINKVNQKRIINYIITNLHLGN